MIAAPPHSVRGQQARSPFLYEPGDRCTALGHKLAALAHNRHPLVPLAGQHPLGQRAPARLAEPCRLARSVELHHPAEPLLAPTAFRFLPDTGVLLAPDNELLCFFAIKL